MQDARAGTELDPGRFSGLHPAEAHRRALAGYSSIYPQAPPAAS